MKHIKILTAVLLSATLLTGCELIYTESSDSESISSSESSSNNTSSSFESTISDNSTPVSSSSTATNKPEPPEIKPVEYPETELKLSSEMEEIIDLFGNFGAFNREYLIFDAIDHVTSRKIADGFTDENDIYFGKVINGSITAYSALIETLKGMLTDKCIEETSEHILDYFRTNDNDELFLRSFGAGGYLGSDYIRINSIDYPDDETISLDMSTVGEKENWGLENDWIDDFKITLKRTDGGLRIDEIDGNPYLDFAFLNNVVYNNVYMVMENAPEYVKQAREESGWQRPLNETEQIFKLLEEQSDFSVPSEDTEKYNKLYLDSIEYPDDNMILVTVTSFDANDNADTAAATIIETENGLCIGDCDSNITDYFGYYNEIFFGGIPQ